MLDQKTKFQGGLAETVACCQLCAMVCDCLPQFWANLRVLLTAQLYPALPALSCCSQYKAHIPARIRQILGICAVPRPPPPIQHSHRFFVCNYQVKRTECDRFKLAPVGRPTTQNRSPTTNN